MACNYCFPTVLVKLVKVRMSAMLIFPTVKITATTFFMSDGEAERDLGMLWSE